MNNEPNSKYVVLPVVVFVLLAQLACSLVGGLTPDEDTRSVDIGVEEAAPPEAEAPAKEPDAAEQDEAPPPTEEVFFEQDGIRLYYDPQLVLDVEPPTETILASSGDEMYGIPHPAYVHFNLYMEQAQVYVAPIQEYKDSDDFAAATISEMETMLNQKPPAVEDCVPELPLSDFFRVCDHQQFTSNIGYFDFQNGSGVRFVSVYGIQDMAPVDNEHLIYVFQGFTDDGKYYVKVIVRLLHSQLPEIGEIPEDIYAATDYTVVEQYFEGFEHMLNDSEEDFSPTLEWIDAFIESLRVE